MKPNRQVVQWLEGCSKEGINYWNTSLSNKSLSNLPTSVSIPYAMSIHEFSFLRHLKKFSSTRNNSDSGIPDDSPYKAVYLRFKNVEIKDDHPHSQISPTTASVVSSHPTKTSVGEETFQADVSTPWYKRVVKRSHASKV
jgi:hypothetical protein